MSKSTYEQFIAEPQNRRLLAQEDYILEETECLARVLKATGNSKAELAEKLGKSGAFVTQILSGSRNMTSRTFADFMFVMGYTARISEAPINAPQFHVVSNNFFVQETLPVASNGLVNKPTFSAQSVAS